MIRFTCKQCDRRHSRPEAEAGTLVFCPCGQGLRVPWPRSAPEDVSPARPVLDAVPVEPPLLEALPGAPLLPRRPARPPGKVHPSFCFHHADRPRHDVCAACGLPFCAACLVLLQGQPLCGPCKNFRVAGLARPRQVVPLSVVALVVGFAGAPVALVLSLVAAAAYLGDGLAGGALLLCLLAALFPAGALLLALLALRRSDALPESTGDSLALSGACAALAGLLWCLCVAAVVAARTAGY